MVMLRQPLDVMSRRPPQPSPESSILSPAASSPLIGSREFGDPVRRRSLAADPLDAETSSV
jgi:hypothetical protein